MRSESAERGTSAVQGVAGYIVRVAERSLDSASDRSATLRGIAAEGRRAAITATTKMG